MEELQEQTVNLLNFQQIENKVFRGQLAFNILPENTSSERSESRVLHHLTEVLGKTFPKPMIRILQAPVFHSCGFSLFVQFLASATPEEVSAELGSIGSNVSAYGDSESPSAVAAAGTDKIHVGRIRMNIDGGNACALWIVADNLRIAASNAVQMAEHIMLAPALDT